MRRAADARTAQARARRCAEIRGHHDWSRRLFYLQPADAVIGHRRRSSPRIDPMSPEAEARRITVHVTVEVSET